MSSGQVLVRHARIVHPHEFKDEVSHSGEVEDDDESLANVGLAAGDISGEEEEENGDNERGNSKGEFVVFAVHDDKELNGEADEEEKVELEEGDVDLLAHQPTYGIGLELHFAYLIGEESLL